MSLSKTIKIPMPKDKITFKKVNGNTIYVYYTTRAYRRESDNKPTSDEVIIGKKDPETGMLIPNNRYYELFKTEEAIYTPTSIKTFGTFYLFDSIVKKMNLYDNLYSIFKDKTKQILTVAYYMLIKGNTIKYINYWCEDNYTYLDTPLVSQRVSELFESITYDERMAFFKLWSKRIIENEYIAYDVTSISSYGSNISTVEWGYNRDGEKLPQINIGMYIGEKNKLPIFYNVYNGSITDKEQLVFMMKYTSELGINNIKFVMDKGFYKKDNLNYMYNNNYKFIICLSNSYNYVRDYVNKAKDSIKQASNWNNKYQLYSMCMQYKQDNKVCNIHIIYNPEKQVLEEREIYATIERLSIELDNLKEIPTDMSKYEKFYNININNKIEYSINNDKVEKSLKMTGYVLFLTSDLVLTPIDVLQIYRNKDTIEKSFNELKNELDYGRLKTHVNKTTDGKIFIGFISLIIRSYLTRSLDELKTNLKKQNYTVQDILYELEKIKVTTLNNEKTTMSAITNAQKTILKIYDISSEINMALLR